MLRTAASPGFPASITCPQKIRALLSMQRGGNIFAETAGVRFYEYFEAFRGTFWLPQMLMLDVIRQAAIPVGDGILTAPWTTPLRCVTRVAASSCCRDRPKTTGCPCALTSTCRALAGGSATWKFICRPGIKWRKARVVLKKKDLRSQSLGTVPLHQKRANPDVTNRSPEPLSAGPCHDPRSGNGALGPGF